MITSAGQEPSPLRPPPGAAGPWSPSGGRLPDCGVLHGGRPGLLDESARRVDHPELAVAALLVGEGHHVTSLGERGRRGPVADFLVCGVPVEVKALLTLAERTDRRPATDRTVHNRLASAVEQAAVVVVATAGSGCREADALAGLRSFVAGGRTGRVRAVRLLGQGFDLSWGAPVERTLDPGTAAVRACLATPTAPRSAPGLRAAARAASRAPDAGLHLG